ncbi:MAG: 30S ribosomal protein S20 [Candidatus Magasanikbacteria bacterium]
MPNLKNAKKALKQSKKKAEINLVVKNTYKKAVKLAKKAVDTDEKDLAEKLRLAQKKLDKAAKKGVIKKNTASRKLSRLMKKANTVAKK